MKFPRDFIWGAATSSYQVEGAAYHDGGGESVWDMLGRIEGRIANGDNGDFACDHYHRYREDIDLMSDIGLQAYRFSVSWPRVLPAGTGAINRQGLDFYNRLVDALLEKNILPWLTLFHWDFPYDLYCRGGWLNRDSADWFADYTALVVDTLSDRVTHWCTLNEPQIYIGLGHLEGRHAPGLRMGFAETLRAAHHTLLAHGRAVQVIRARARRDPFISATHAGSFIIPDSENPADVETARRLNFSVGEKNFHNNTWFSDPMVLGRYPEDGVELFGRDMPDILPGDLETISQTLDYFGTNIYSGRYVRAGGDIGFEIVHRENQGYTEMGWPITPEVMYWSPRFFTERYDLPLVVTENGMASADAERDGVVDDEKRIEFLRGYLGEYARAIADGVPCIGYLLWSLLDNFEWDDGYARRFGMIYVDYETQQRTLKDSAYWYSHVIAANEIPVSHSRTLPAAV